MQSLHVIDRLVILDDESAEFVFVWDPLIVVTVTRGGGGSGPFDSGFGFNLSMNRLMDDTTSSYISWNSSFVA
jgi:hypothetical protein